MFLKKKKEKKKSMCTFKLNSIGADRLYRSHNGGIALLQPHENKQYILYVHKLTVHKQFSMYTIHTKK